MFMVCFSTKWEWNFYISSTEFEILCVWMFESLSVFILSMYISWISERCNFLKMWDLVEIDSWKYTGWKALYDIYCTIIPGIYKHRLAVTLIFTLILSYYLDSHRFRCMKYS